MAIREGCRELIQRSPKKTRGSLGFWRSRSVSSLARDRKKDPQLSSALLSLADRSDRRQKKERPGPATTKQGRVWRSPVRLRRTRLTNLLRPDPTWRFGWETPARGFAFSLAWGTLPATKRPTKRCPALGLTRPPRRRPDVRQESSIVTVGRCAPQPKRTVPGYSHSDGRAWEPPVIVRASANPIEGDRWRLSGNRPVGP